MIGSQMVLGNLRRSTRNAGGMAYPAYYQQPTNFMQATNAYAPPLVQFGIAVCVLKALSGFYTFRLT